MATINSTAAVFSIPLELLDLILEQLDQRSVLSLSFTCKAAAGAQLFEKHIYRDLTYRDDIPLGTFDDFKRNYRPRHRRILNGLNGRTGPMVKTMAVHRYMSADALSEIACLCPNLKEIDFTAVQECIDWAYWRRDEQGRGTWNLGFRWYIAFRSLPALFSHLASVSVNVSWACDWFAGKYDVAATHQYRNFIPQLFEACPVLHHLTLHAQPGDLPDPQSWRIRLTHTRTRPRLLGQSLKTITLVNAAFILAHRIPHQWLQWFPRLETLRVDLYRSFRIICTYSGLRSKITQYIENLESLRQNTSYRLKVSDASSAADFPLDLGKFSGLPQESFKTLARLSFVPVWNWTSSYLIHTNIDEAPYQHISAYQSQLHPAYKATLAALKAHNIPINITLGSGSSTSFFPSDAERRTRSIKKYPHPDSQNCWLLEELGKSVTSLSLVYDPAFASSDAATDYCGRKRDESTGRFQKVQHLPPQDPEVLVERLGRESEGLGRFFTGLKRICPDLKRLEVFMPKALFPSTDAEFVDEVLPTGTWSITHPLTHPPPPLLSLPVRYPFASDGFSYAIHVHPPSITDPSASSYKKRPKTTLQKHQHKCRQVDQERCPFVTRVFTRIAGLGPPDSTGSATQENLEENGNAEEASKGEVKESETSKFWRRYRMERPEIDAPEPTMMDWVRKERVRVKVGNWLGRTGFGS